MYIRVPLYYFFFLQARTQCIPAGNAGQCTNLVNAPCPTGNDVCCADGDCEADAIGMCTTNAMCSDATEEVVVGTCTGANVCCATLSP